MERLTKVAQEIIADEVERLIPEYPIKVFIGGKQVDIDDQTKVGEEIHISIETPVFFTETGLTGFVTIEEPKRMAD